MADITKCSGEGCEQKKFCYRFTALASKYRQAWFTNPPIDSNGYCDEYWEMQCRYCGQYNGIHKLDCETNKITVKL